MTRVVTNVTPVGSQESVWVHHQTPVKATMESLTRNKRVYGILLFLFVLYTPHRERWLLTLLPSYFVYLFLLGLIHLCRLGCLCIDQEFTKENVVVVERYAEVLCCWSTGEIGGFNEERLQEFTGVDQEHLQPNQHTHLGRATRSRRWNMSPGHGPFNIVYLIWWSMQLALGRNRKSIVFFPQFHCPFREEKGERKGDETMPSSHGYRFDTY